LCDCGGYLKPDTISFGQAMPEEATRRPANVFRHDVFIVVGSTLLVQPAALMPVYARDGGAFSGCHQPVPHTPMMTRCQVLIQEKAGPVLEDIAARVVK
jgi:NAD-dependent deacetylase